MNFKPLSEKELEEKTKLPKGNFPATVLSAENTVSKKSGAEMIKLTVCVFVESRKLHVTDYLLGSMEVKLRHFCECAGLMEEYEAGTLSAEHCDGKDVMVRVAPEKSEGFADKLVIKDYVPERKQAAPKTAPSTLAPDPNDDIPGVAKSDLPF